MAIHREQVLDLPGSFYLKLLVLGLIGYFGPELVQRYWPDSGWAAEVGKAHQLSMRASIWKEPWQSLQAEGFGAGFVACKSLEDALELDLEIDDGNLHSGRLVLTEEGLAWRPE